MEESDRERRKDMKYQECDGGRDIQRNGGGDENG